MTDMKTYRDLDIWKKSIDLVKEIYKITDKFPNTEMYALTSQMRRAVISIPSNIAEGHRRSYSKEFKRFLNIALSSLAELETQVIIAKELEYIKSGEEIQSLELVDHTSRMITNLSKKL